MAKDNYFFQMAKNFREFGNKMKFKVEENF